MLLLDRKPLRGIGFTLIVAAILPPNLRAQGVGDHAFKRPPYHTGQAVPAGARWARLPIAYQRGGAEPEIFHPAGGAGTPIAGLLEEMNAYLDSLGGWLSLAGAASMPSRAPDVVFGCRMDAAGDCAERDDDTRVEREPELLLHVDRPTRAWREWIRAALDSVGVDYLLVITLEVGQYWPRQANFKGDKVVDLGTGHAALLPWLTSLETPVGVVQLTGAVVDREGKVVRVGAEGLLARRTALAESSIGLQALIREEDAADLRGARREDLSEQPLVWRVALRELLARLARPDLRPPRS